MNKELDLLQIASNEIKQLRNQNNIMRTRLDMFDNCMLLLTANIQSNQQGVSPDITWEIDKYIESGTIVSSKNNT